MKTITLSQAEQHWFDFFCRVYVQRADARQEEMGLQYTEAETHDLACEVVREIERLSARLTPKREMDPA